MVDENRIKHLIDAEYNEPNKADNEIMLMRHFSVYSDHLRNFILDELIKEIKNVHADQSGL